MKKNFMDIGLIYLIGQFLVKGISFLLIPLYSRYLGAEVYGELAIVDIFLSAFNIICTFSISSGYIRFYNEDVENKGFTTAFNFSIITICIYGLLIYTTGKYFSNVILGVKNSYFILLLIFFRGSIEQLIVLLESRYSMEYMVKKIIFLRLIMTFISLGTIIFMVVYSHKTISGIYIGWIIGQIPILFYLVWDNRKKLKFILDIKLLKKMSSFSMGLLIGGMSYIILAMIDRFFLKEYKTFTDVGIYAMGYKFGALFEVFFIYAFKKIFTPFKFREYENHDFQLKINKFYTYYSFLGIVICLIISVNIKWILAIFTTSDFIVAYTVTPLIILSYFFYGYAEFYTLGIYIKNKAYLDSLVIFVGAGVNTVSNFYLISKYGMYGAALSTILSYLAMNFIYLTLSRRMYFIRFNVKESIKITVIGILFYLIYFYISLLKINIFVESMLGNLILIISIIVLYKCCIPLEIKSEMRAYIYLKMKVVKKIDTNM